MQKSDIFKVKHATTVETTKISSENYCDGRYARTGITVADAGALNGDACSQLTVRVDFGGGCVYDVCINSLANATAATLRTAILNDTALASKVCVTIPTAGCLSIENKTAGQDFTISVTMVKTNALATGTFSFGTAVATGTAYVGSCSYSFTTNNATYVCEAAALGIYTTQATKNVTAVTMNCAMKEGVYSINTARCIDAGEGVGVANVTNIGNFYSCLGSNMITAVNTAVSCSGQNQSTIFIVDSVCQANNTAQVSFLTHGMYYSGCNNDETTWHTVCVTLGGASWYDKRGYCDIK